MNPLRAEAALYVDHAWLLGLTTVVFIACFIGWTWWAWSSHNRERIAAAAMMPLTEDES